MIKRIGGLLVMENTSQVKLVSYNIKNVEISASAARISTTLGNAVDIFDRAKGDEKDRELVKKVLRSGHKSIIEHVFFTFALKDVSAFVEQFFIECRLVSFTVKSRRYVDFSNLGYYIPSDLAGENLEQYCSYMDNLFSAYKVLLENGIPKEDARFLLPYSFNSNFYCTLNARELIHIIYDMKYGRGQGIIELQNLASQIITQVEEIFPCIRFEVEAMQSEDDIVKVSDNIIKVEDAASFIDSEEIGTVSLLNKPLDPGRILSLAYSIKHPNRDNSLEVSEMLKSKRLRELEQLSYSFLISNITLSGITHIVRHRMQSIIIPSIQAIEHSKFIIPNTIKNDSRSLDIYKNVLEKSNDMMKYMSNNEELRKYSYYYALSGNVMNIMTTINARELMHFIKLRACDRAQWEIRDIAIDMLKLLRSSFPELFNCFGPSCFVTGICPEGSMSCGKQKEIFESFEDLT